MEQTEECVVYKITNIVNSRVYIGVTTNFKRRMKEHTKSPNKKILKDIDEFGFTFDGNFDKEIVFQGKTDWCYNKEIELISKLKPFYNTALGGNTLNCGGGEKHPSAKLSNKEAMEVRYLCSYTDYSYKYIGKLYEVSGTAISYIARGHSYDEAEGPISNINNMLGDNNNKTKIADKDIETIRIRASNTKDSLAKIAKDYDVTIKAIDDIIKGKTREKEKGPIRKDGYGNKGERNGDNSKLKDRDILIIRERRKNGETYIQIAEDYPVGRQNISLVCRGKRWDHISGPIEGKDYEPKKGSILDKDDIINIRERGYNTKDTYKEIAKDYPVGYYYIGEIIRGKKLSDEEGPILGRDYVARGEGNV